MSKGFLNGAIIISVATLVSKILGSVFRIPLQNIAGNEVFGIFSLVYPVYMAVLILSVAGIPLAISKLISEARVNGDERQIRDIFVTASILGASFGLISFIVIYVLSEPIAELLGGSYATLSIIVVSATLLVAPYMAVYRGFFQGYDDMNPTAISQVLEQFVRVTMILVIAYVLVAQGYSEEIVAAGVMIGSILGALCSLIYLRWIFLRSTIKPISSEPYKFQTFRTWAKKILALSLPICVGALAMALLNFIDSITVPQQLQAIGYRELAIADLFGIYGRGTALVQIAVVFSSALILPLIPLITGSLAKGEIDQTRSMIEKALKFTHMFSWPAAMGLFALTLPINFGFFGDYEGNPVIAIVHFSALFTSFTVLTTGILQGMNKSKQAAWIVTIGAALKVILNIVLIRNFGLIGVAWSTLIVYVLVSVLNISWMYKGIPFKVWARSHTVFAVSSLIMALVIVAPTFFMDPMNWSRGFALGYVVIMVMVGALVYGVLILALKGLGKEELQSLPVVGKYFRSTVEEQ
ncbi:putative polysaccharide biosynthesis protein [Texcoconibacillus texcoconensis]|uniref:O-antigen/teichoic acid export membrane protein n=1 Tax=Texcoconibacillus texcoconensis TaxID=1095777 RepID=A0A840QQY6_9BACI|nr:polysaccharide biosynthesis protein [Texcoconibacillus texcoconensis]MBB5173784.1 O-antigen/teichoic acid export membrane protein [Texcoconibacillus texcoconensis]